MQEKSLVLLKPDAVEQGLETLITQEIEARGLKCMGRKQLTLTEELVRRHYPHHAGKPYFPRIVAYMTRGPCVALVFEGPDAIDKIRKLAGATDPEKAERGSLRARFGLVERDGAGAVTRLENVLHASDSPDDATREKFFFFTA